MSQHYVYTKTGPHILQRIALLTPEEENAGMFDIGCYNVMLDLIEKQKDFPQKIERRRDGTKKEDVLTLSKKLCYSS